MSTSVMSATAVTTSAVAGRGVVLGAGWVLHRHLIALRLALMLEEGVGAALVVLAVSLVGFGDGEVAAFWQRTGIDISLAAALFGVAWVTALWYLGLYRLRAHWHLAPEVWGTLKAAAGVATLILAALFVFRQNDVSRHFFVILFAAEVTVTVTGRFFIRKGFEAVRCRGYDPHYVLIAGTGPVAQCFADWIEQRPGLGLRIIGHLSAPGEPEAVVSRPILGRINDMPAIFRNRTVDEVAVCLPPAAVQWQDQVAGFAAAEGRIVRILLDSGHELSARAHSEEFPRFSMHSLIPSGQRPLELAFKRLVDVAGAAVGMVILGPLILGTALAIRLIDGSPVLFRQTRYGLNGRRFTLHKFRTMVPDAEAQLAGLWARSDIVGPAIQLAHDPRVTPLGSFLRRTSLDELPQLWNVLKGEMSLVGPRPAPDVEVAKYDMWHRRRLSARPGITGLAQVTMRTYKAFDDRASLDMRYIDTWSLWLDLRIMARTVAVVFAGTGK